MVKANQVTEFWELMLGQRGFIVSDHLNLVGHRFNHGILSTDAKEFAAMVTACLTSHHGLPGPSNIRDYMLTEYTYEEGSVMCTYVAKFGMEVNRVNVFPPSWNARYE